MEELVIWGAGAIGGTVGAFLSRADKLRSWWTRTRLMSRR